MPPTGLSAALARARRAVAPADSRTDGALLAAFVAARDGAAFAALVERFGRMVFTVCRRTTGHHQDAEDAFQAVFVVLARKAAAVVPREAVGGWLYGVAVRTAREARKTAARRAAREAPLIDAARGVALPDPDLAAVIDAELAGLPEKYRTLLVRCDLRDEPQVEVAAALGVPVGTVYSRLAAARKQLAARLTARGVAPGVGGLAVALGEAASAAVPADLPARAVAAALTPESTPAAVAALSHGVLRAMFLHKLRLAPLALAAVASVALGAGLFASPPAAPPAPPARVALAEAQPPAPKAAPLPKGPNRIVLYLDGRLTLIDPNGKNAVSITEVEGKHHPHPSPRLSPDGSRVAYTVQTRAPVLPKPGEAPAPGGEPEYRLYVRKTTGNDPPTDLGVRAHTFAWYGDGTRIAATDFVATGEKLKGVHKVVTVATKAVEALPLPEDHVLTDWSRDGRYFVTQQAVPSKEKGRMPVFRLRLLNRDGTEHKVANAPTDILMNGRLSPDGKRLLCEQYLILDADGRRVIRLPVVLDLTTGAVAPMIGYPPDSELQGYCWSPDGRRVAYAWREKLPPGAVPIADADVESFLVVCDADGRNATTVARAKGNSPGLVTLAGPDWR